jgi:hypothetical protein
VGLGALSWTFLKRRMPLTESAIDLTSAMFLS